MKFAAAVCIATILVSSSVKAAGDTRTIECSFEPAMGTSLNDGKFERKPVNFKDMNTPWVYRFKLGHAKPGGNQIDVEVLSEKDFATITGQYKAFSVAPETYIIHAFKVGSCMFSSQICGATIQLTDLDSDNAAAAMVPVSYFGDQKDATFFHVDLVGKCVVIPKIGTGK